MDIPVQLGAGIQLGVRLREQNRGEPWREERVDELVEGEGEENFMNVLGEGRTIQP